jgi:hypothetical protein
MASSPEHLRAHVENGRVVVDDPVDLPNGTRLNLIVDTTLGDESERTTDELTDKEHEVQQAMPWVRFAKEAAPPITAEEKEALRRSLDLASRGDVVPHDQVMRDLGLEEFAIGDTTKVDSTRIRDAR